MMNIYLTNLGKYNEGELLGEWVTLPVSDEELQQVLTRIGINEEYEEYFITDFECDYYDIGEYESIDKLNEIAESVESMDEYDREILKALLSEGFELSEAINKIDDCMVYADCNDMTDVAHQYIEETGLLNEIPENLQNYFDYEAFGRDMSFDGHWIATDNGYINVLY